MAELSSADKRILAAAPAAVFALVAGADGKIDRKEQRRFEAMLGADHNAGSAVIGEILAAAPKEGPEVLEEAGGDCELVLDRVRKTAESALSEEDRAKFKQGLWMMGEALAQTSGGGILGIGKRVDQAESVALRRLRELLKI